MKNRQLIVFEYQTLKIGPNSTLLETDLNLLSKFHCEGGSQYYDLIHQGVQFKQYVGVLRINDLTIEVLPKIDRSKNANSQLWRNVLLKMLGVCKNMNVDMLPPAQLSTHSNSILDIYIQLFINEIQSLVSKGLVKKYRKSQNNFTSLKGRLIFGKNIQQNLTRKERFLCEKNQYQIDHAQHQIIKQALGIVSRISNQKHLSHIRSLLLYFDTVRQLSFTKSEIDNLFLDRKSLQYRKAIDLSRMFILNYSPNISSGKHELICLMFDMNELWEEYIYRILSKHRPANTIVSFQNSKKFWENRTVRPDIVIQQNSEPPTVRVIDTKWKIIKSGLPDEKDLKQLFTYNLLWGAEKSLLLYPRLHQPSSSFGSYHYISKGKSSNQCKTAFISILDNTSLRSSSDIALQIFNELE